MMADFRPFDPKRFQFEQNSSLPSLARSSFLISAPLRPTLCPSRFEHTRAAPLLACLPALASRLSSAQLTTQQHGLQYYSLCQLPLIGATNTPTQTPA